MRRTLDNEEFENFVVALCHLGRQMERLSTQVHIPREVLADILSETQDKSERDFWASLSTNKELLKWAGNSRKGPGPAGELEVLYLADELPYRIRKSLLTVAKRLPPKRGGKARTLNVVEAWRARSEVKNLLACGLSRKAAYERVAATSKKGVHWHTIRRVCEPKKREHRRLTKSFGLLAL